nr:helix-turn-helix domain-containing protein [Kineosporia mesophila]
MSVESLCVARRLAGSSTRDHHGPRTTHVRGGFVAESVKKGARITGTDRSKLAGELKKKYTSGASIRALAEETGRSYGFVHRILTENEVQLRGRGGATRGKAKQH